jgi:hypothetical protein
MVTANTRRHLKLRKTLPEYAAAFDVGVSTLKFWIRRGKDLGQLVPLDEPEKFPDWWRACMSGPVPSRFLVSGTSTNGNGHAPLTQKRDFSDVKGLGIEANVQALRRTLEINGRLLEEALLANDDRLFASRQRMYGDCFNRLRLAEQSLTELQKQRGQLIDREQVSSDLSKIAGVLKQIRETMPRRVLSHLGHDLSLELTERMERAITREREAEDAVFRNLKLEGIAKTELTRLGLLTVKTTTNEKNNITRNGNQ